MTQLFTRFSQILNHAEKVSFSIERQADTTLRLIVTPELKAAPDNLADDLAQLRGALALPLVITDTAEKLDQDFMASLTTYANSRTSLGNSLDALKEAAKTAQNKVSHAKAKVQKKDKATDAETGTSASPGGTAPAPTAPASVTQASDADLL